MSVENKVTKQYLEELQILNELSKDNNGDEISKLQHETVTTKMKLEIFKKQLQDQKLSYEQRRKSNTTRWRGARRFDCKDYGTKVLNDHIHRITKLKTKRTNISNSINKTKSQTTSKTCKNSTDKDAICPQIRDPPTPYSNSFATSTSVTNSDNLTSMSEQSTASITSTTNNANSTSVNIDTAAVDTTSEMKEESIPESNECKTEISTGTDTIGTKKCCYHCYRLFVPNLIDSVSIENDSKWFCNQQCLLNYEESVKLCCKHENCNQKFYIQNGIITANGVYCKEHASQNM